MTYLTIVLLLFTIALTYKKFNSLSTLFLYGIIIGWIASFFSYLFYISKFNVYFSVISKFYDFSPGSWNRLVLNNFNPDLLIRLLNGGVILFSYSLLFFSISYTASRRNSKNIIWYIPLIILALIQALYYDPIINLSLQNYFYGQGYQQSVNFNLARNIINSVFLYMKYISLILSFTLLIKYYFKNHKIKFIKKYTLFHIMCLVPVSIIHTLIFSWAPKILVKATFIADFHNYLKPKINNLIYEINIFPIISILALGLMIFTFSRYQLMEKHYKNMDAEINKKIKTASLGVKAFTHSIKNHLLAIKSEAEFLKDRLASDKEALYSLDLIMNSCLMSYETLNNASDKLNTLSLTIQMKKLHIPVEMALSKLTSVENQMNIIFKRESMGSKTYMDENYMSEVYYNIIINAIESLRGQPDGTITITVEEQELWGFVSIEDNGPGISPEHINDVFAPFFSTKASSSNWGVGLSYCHKIVTAHNGKIEVESIENKGTTFKVFLPLA